MSKRRKQERFVNLHHRLPKKENGSSHPSNISEVPVVKHEAYNRLFSDGHMHPVSIAKQLTEVWIRPDWRMVAVPKPAHCVNCGRCELKCKEDTPWDAL